MESRAEYNQTTLERGWQNAQSLRSSLKSGLRDDDIEHSHTPLVKSVFRRSPLFSRRKNTSLVNRIIWLLLVWSVVVYILGVAGLWWGTNKVIEDNFSQQATDWVAKLDELGTPLYAANDEFLFQSIEEQVSRFPEVSYLRYYEAERNSVIAQYSANNLGDIKIPELSSTIIERLRLNIDSSKPVLIQTADDNSSLFQVASSIVTRSIRSESMLDFDIDEDTKENYKIIG
ncbi:MAG: hypothetical protein OQK46_10000, partial [Gammaproteobacteria bacterium]|nr:hypothetical protein [Gammaproteobacteria bacterium]